MLARERDYFGNFDPFGDFDLIFGAAKQNLKIIETPDPLQGAHIRRDPDLALSRRLAAAENGVVRLSQAQGGLIAGWHDDGQIRPAPDQPPRGMGAEGNDPAIVSGLSQAAARELPRGAAFSISAAAPRTSRIPGPTSYPPTSCRFPGIDVVADAHRLPFPGGYFSGVVMLDVLHHLERPIEFLSEASRVLRPGGRLAMIEPAMTPIARRFYQNFHEEPVDMSADPFAPVAIDPDRDPFDANQAIPSLLFTSAAARSRLEAVVPSLRVTRVGWLSLFAYPLSGGFQNWSLMPAALVRPDAGHRGKNPGDHPKANGLPNDGRTGSRWSVNAAIGTAGASAFSPENPSPRLQNQPSNRAFRDRRNRPPETLKKGKKSPFIQ